VRGPVAAAARSWRENGRWLSMVATLVLGGAGVGWGVSGIELEQAHEAAVVLLDDGRPVTVDDVEVLVRTSRGDTTIDEVRVTVPVDGRPVRTPLIGVEEEDTDAADGWGRPPEGSRYAPPLDLLVLPRDPAVAMAAADVDLRRESRWGTDLAVSGTLLGAAVGFGVAWLRAARREDGPGRRYRRR
jgi:hypothetical protein